MFTRKKQSYPVAVIGAQGTGKTVYIAMLYAQSSQGWVTARGQRWQAEWRLGGEKDQTASYLEHIARRILKEREFPAGTDAIQALRFALSTTRQNRTVEFTVELHDPKGELLDWVIDHGAGGLARFGKGATDQFTQTVAVWRKAQSILFFLPWINATDQETGLRLRKAIEVLVGECQLKPSLFIFVVTGASLAEVETASWESTMAARCGGAVAYLTLKGIAHEFCCVESLGRGLIEPVLTEQLVGVSGVEKCLQARAVEPSHICRKCQRLTQDRAAEHAPVGLFDPWESLFLRTARWQDRYPRWYALAGLAAGVLCLIAAGLQYAGYRRDLDRWAGAESVFASREAVPPETVAQAVQKLEAFGGSRFFHYLQPEKYAQANDWRQLGRDVLLAKAVTESEMTAAEKWSAIWPVLPLLKQRSFQNLVPGPQLAELAWFYHLDRLAAVKTAPSFKSLWHLSQLTDKAYGGTLKADELTRTGDVVLAALAKDAEAASAEWASAPRVPPQALIGQWTTARRRLEGLPSWRFELLPTAKRTVAQATEMVTAADEIHRYRQSLPVKAVPGDYAKRARLLRDFALKFPDHPLKQTVLGEAEGDEGRYHQMQAKQDWDVLTKDEKPPGQLVTAILEVKAVQLDQLARDHSGTEQAVPAAAKAREYRTELQARQAREILNLLPSPSLLNPVTDQETIDKAVTDAETLMREYPGSEAAQEVARGLAPAYRKKQELARQWVAYRALPKDSAVFALTELPDIDALIEDGKRFLETAPEHPKAQEITTRNANFTLYKNNLIRFRALVADTASSSDIITIRGALRTCENMLGALPVSQLRSLVGDYLERRMNRRTIEVTIGPMIYAGAVFSLSNRSADAFKSARYVIKLQQMKAGIVTDTVSSPQLDVGPQEKQASVSISCDVDHDLMISVERITGLRVVVESLKVETTEIERSLSQSHRFKYLEVPFTCRLTVGRPANASP